MPIILVEVDTIVKLLIISFMIWDSVLTL